MRAILEEIGKELETIKTKDGKDLKLTKKQLLARKSFIEALAGDYRFLKFVTAYMDGLPEQKSITELKGSEIQPINIVIQGEIKKDKK